MTRLVSPGARQGEIAAPASKSTAHRLLIGAALADGPSELNCRGISRDIEATVACLRALGADIQIQDERIRVLPLTGAQEGEALLPCGESGSTLRFLLPVAGALGRKVTFRMEGRLPERPHGALTGALAAHGMTIAQEGALLRCEGRLTPGEYEIPGDVSSQFISGLLFALALLPGDSVLRVTGRRESSGYVAMTEAALARFGIAYEKGDGLWRTAGGAVYRSPGGIDVEGDWSGAAFFLCMGAASPGGIAVRGLSADTRQGDRRILDVLRGFGARVEEKEDAVLVSRHRLIGQTVDAADVPDLVPTVAALAAGAEGETRIVNAGRLRYKESDRLATTQAMLTALGADAVQTGDGLLIRGQRALSGGRADAAGDHRIAMAAAVAAAFCQGPVEVTGAESVEKSYPAFWRDLEQLEVLK